MVNPFTILVGSLLVLFSTHCRADEGAQVYQKVLHSTVWIHSSRGDTRYATGSGSLVDRNHRLVLTNYHVVGSNPRAIVTFPSFKEGKVIAERDYYNERIKRQGIRARVIALDRRHDLALLQLESLPEGAEALPLAGSSPTPGQSVHSIGNPGGSGALWVYTPGKVRQVYFKKWKADLDGKETTFEAEVIETDSPTNPGDSGGPLVNDAAQLVGVTHGGAVNARLLSTFIDVSEVKALLGSSDVRAVTGGEAVVPPRSIDTLIQDKANLFGQETIKKVLMEIQELQKKSGREIQVETHLQVPASDREKVQGMNGEQRDLYFRKWAQERVRSEGIRGGLILICKEPRHLHVQFSRGYQQSIPEGDTRQIVNILINQFKEKKYDAGLEEAVRLMATTLQKEQIK